MKFSHFLFLITALLSISATPVGAAPISGPEMTLGRVEATVGLNPQTATPSGWYTSEVALQVLAPADALANGQPVVNGQVTLTEEGQHLVEFQPGPFGAANRVTQFVNIDRTPPRVTWLTEPNPELSGYGTLSAEITDATSGLCSLEWSFNYGDEWESQRLAAPLAGEKSAIQATTWSLSRDFADFPSGAQVLLLRAWDCAGNVSPGELLVVQVK
jgi:hypothetical protein